ncbi:MAG: agmatinase [Phycisphaerales bacterium]|nr:MAG: agmatinase [Phycisphaerales bacterium]
MKHIDEAARDESRARAAAWRLPSLMPTNSSSPKGPRTILPDPRQTPRFAGISTFCRYPRAEDVDAAHRPIDWLLYGVPFDSGVTYRPGARFAPRAIRDASQYVKSYHMTHRVSVVEKLSIADAGDAPVQPYALKETLEGIAAWATNEAKSHGGTGNPSRLLAVGGDHSIAYANIKATHAGVGQPLALVHFDAHLDTVDNVWGESWGHASPFRRAIEEKLIDPMAMVSIGVRGPLNTPTDLEFARDHGVTILTREEVATDAGKRSLATKVREIGSRPAYLTFDIDAIDPAFAPGTGTPNVGGLSSTEALELLRSLKGIDVVGADVVEVLPDRDPAGITAFLAAHIVFEILALDAARR